jgi:hypothetical protein
MKMFRYRTKKLPDFQGISGKRPMGNIITRNCPKLKVVGLDCESVVKFRYLSGSIQHNFCSTYPKKSTISCAGSEEYKDKEKKTAALGGS